VTFLFYEYHTSTEITFNPFVLINQSFSGDTSTDWCDMKNKSARIMFQAAAKCNASSHYATLTIYIKI
jgi:hypothetical protein